MKNTIRKGEPRPTQGMGKSEEPPDVKTSLNRLLRSFSAKSRVGGAPLFAGVIKSSNRSAAVSDMSNHDDPNEIKKRLGRTRNWQRQRGRQGQRLRIAAIVDHVEADRAVSGKTS